jgi:hypothetical protein
MGGLAFNSNSFSQTGQLKYSVHCGAWIGILNYLIFHFFFCPTTAEQLMTVAMVAILAWLTFTRAAADNTFKVCSSKAPAWPWNRDLAIIDHAACFFKTAATAAPSHHGQMTSWKNGCLLFILLGRRAERWQKMKLFGQRLFFFCCTFFHSNQFLKWSFELLSDLIVLDEFVWIFTKNTSEFFSADFGCCLFKALLLKSA